MKTLLFFILTFNAYALEFSSEGKKLNFQWIAKDFDQALWGIDFIEKDKVILTGKEGTVWIYDLTKKTKEKLSIEFPNLYVGGQGGLLDVKYHAGSLYFSYSYKTSKGRTTAFRKTDLKGNGENFYVANAYTNNRYHFGSRFEIVGDDLFATVGDRGVRERAQDKKWDNGKILKFDLKNLKSFKQFTLGHRNPQGIAYHPKWKTLINGEFGPQGGDELNLLKEGNNYGWPIITYGEEYGGGKIGIKVKKGLEQPIKYWTPSLSFSGIGFYTSDGIPEWKDNLFLACLGTQQLYRLVLDKELKVTKEESLLSGLNERIRMVREGLNGELYIITDSGKLGVITKI